MNQEQKVLEYHNSFNKDGTELEFKIKTECSTEKEMQKALHFMAQSSHRFYLDVAEKISNML